MMGYLAASTLLLSLTLGCSPLPGSETEPTSRDVEATVRAIVEKSFEENLSGPSLETTVEALVRAALPSTTPTHTPNAQATIATMVGIRFRIGYQLWK